MDRIQEEKVDRGEGRLSSLKATLIYVVIFLSMSSVILYFTLTDIYTRPTKIQPAKWNRKAPVHIKGINRHDQFRDVFVKNMGDHTFPSQHQPASVSTGTLQTETATEVVEKTDNSATSGKPKLVLSWSPTPDMDYMTLRHIKKPEFKNLGCKVHNCIYTEDKSLSDKSDAIVFISRSLARKPRKLPHQRWAWVTHESSCHSGENGGEWSGMFNWTMTFRRDADIYTPFAFINERATPLGKNFTEIALKKTKLVAWMVSNCNTHSKRESYVAELKKYIPVDIFGSCGPFRCSKRENEKCLSMVSRDYKFYLAFENSISTDYVSDKFLKIIEREIVAVSRGPANYSRVGIKPSWHINTNDFKSPKDLADYLKYLDKNITAYVSYLEWKNHYVLGSRLESYCELCAKLNDPNEPVTWYKPGEIYQWFNKGHCVPPKDLTFAGRKKR